ncbi:MAG: type II secretion system protein GspC [Pseudomonadota bacterium]|nr:type II secretion system protein GspC [Pseudomonadota bacterium]
MMNTLTLQPTDLVRLMQGVWMQRAIWIINLLLVIWLASLLATLTWGLIDKPESAESVPVETVPIKPIINQHVKLVRKLPEWHLFGKAVRATAPAKIDVPVDAPDTRLKLVLHGAFASDAPRFARAIIADPRGREEMYAIGDKVPGNAKLQEIHIDRVILMRGGRYETLRLPEERSSAGGGTTVSHLGASKRKASAPSKRLSSIRQRLKKNPKSLYGLVRTTPKKNKKGKMVGYTLKPGREPELFEQMGLQAGDVVTQINDISLNTLSNGVRALKSVQSGETVSMTVLRDGEEQALSFNVPE